MTKDGGADRESSFALVHDLGGLVFSRNEMSVNA